MQRYSFFALLLAGLCLWGCGSSSDATAVAPDASDASPSDAAADAIADSGEGSVPDGATALEGGLLGAANLSYEGAFRVPGGNHGDPNVYDTFAYGGTALAYNAVNSSLFLVGHDWDQLVGEIGIPQVVKSNNLDDLSTATVLQQVKDITEGHMGEVGTGGAVYSDSVKVGGLMPFGGKLVGTVFIYYDAASFAARSHFTSGFDLAAVGDFSGMYSVGTLNPGFVGGYMAPIPSSWQADLGGPALTGLCCVSIVGRTSLGPAASVFDPSALGKSDPAAATPVVGYPLEHPTLGEWGNTTTANPVYNQGSQVTGLVFPEEARSVLFFGRTGLGIPCYGEGTSDQALDRQPVPGETGVVYCYDPGDSSKGTHAFPYAYYVWAYDVLDLISVKGGHKQPWDLKPYSTWALDLPFAPDGKALHGVAYDPQGKRIFVSQANGDANGMPVIHVFSIKP